MNSILKKITFLIAGLCIGIIGTIFVFRILHFSKNFMHQEYSFSTSILKDKIQNFGVILPEKAYDIDFYFTCGIDYDCWIAFSANDTELQKTIKELESPKLKNKAEPFMPKNRDGKSIIPWWPSNHTGLEIHYGQLCWMGYDKTKLRLFIYKYSL